MVNEPEITLKDLARDGFKVAYTPRDFAMHPVGYVPDLPYPVLKAVENAFSSWYYAELERARLAVKGRKKKNPPPPPRLIFSPSKWRAGKSGVIAYGMITLSPDLFNPYKGANESDDAMVSYPPSGGFVIRLSS